MNSDHSPKTGHVFAQISQKAWLSEIFGYRNPFSIMNYGEKSQLTREDVDDLKKTL